MKKDFNLLPPTMPNFIAVEVDGVEKWPNIPIAILSEEEAEEYAQLMAEAFMKHWQNKVSQLTNQN